MGLVIFFRFYWLLFFSMCCIGRWVGVVLLCFLVCRKGSMFWMKVDSLIVCVLCFCYFGGSSLVSWFLVVIVLRCVFCLISFCIVFFNIMLLGSVICGRWWWGGVSLMVFLLVLVLFNRVFCVGKVMFLLVLFLDRWLVGLGNCLVWLLCMGVLVGCVDEVLIEVFVGNGVYVVKLRC